jgi:hypothetical protein
MNEMSAQFALEEYLVDAKIPIHATETGYWFIDVGVEYSAMDGPECLQWSTSSHFHVVRDVLRIPDNHASRITSIGSTKYARDVVSHLPAVSGCRIEPGIQAEGPFEVQYFQMYTTDKAITYNPEGGYHGKAITMDVAMGPSQPPPFLNGLYGVYRSAMDENASNARIEVRVPFRHATRVLLNVDSHVIRNSLMSFTLDEWWLVVQLMIITLTNVCSQGFQSIPTTRPFSYTCSASFRTPCFACQTRSSSSYCSLFVAYQQPPCSSRRWTCGEESNEGSTTSY